MNNGKGGRAAKRGLLGDKIAERYRGQCKDVSAQPLERSEALEMDNGQWTARLEETLDPSRIDNGQCKAVCAQPLERSEALPLTGERGEGLGGLGGLGGLEGLGGLGFALRLRKMLFDLGDDFHSPAAIEAYGNRDARV